jgi:hypothetical protein
MVIDWLGAALADEARRKATGLPERRDIAPRCANNGKHEGTGRYHMCGRCRRGDFLTPCGDFKEKEFG